MSKSEAVESLETALRLCSTAAAALEDDFLVYLIDIVILQAKSKVHESTMSNSIPI
jgi:hypothetical protein